MEFSLCVNNWLNLALSYEFVIYRSAKFYGISPWLLKKIRYSHTEVTRQTGDWMT